MAFDVDISPMSVDRFRSVLSPEQIEAFERGEPLRNCVERERGY